MGDVLVEAADVSKTFGVEKRFVVLDGVSLRVEEGEFAAVLGPTGCGKTTLLRILTGLLQPERGVVRYCGQELTGVNTEAAIVFQGCALFPWLTVQENVEVVLRARGLPASLSGTRAIQLLDMVGLDGFENAYPRELSGGMLQKAGFARALAVEPHFLCLDEPFSSLDVLSADSLRGELLELWTSHALPARCIMLVTHEIEEAVFLADRIFVMQKNPGRIMGEIRVALPHPRSRKAQEFVSLVDRIYAMLSGTITAEEVEKKALTQKVEINRFLPEINVNDIVGLVERLDEEPSNRADIYRLAEDLSQSSDRMLQLMDAAQMLGFVTIFEGDIILTLLGQTFAEASIQARKGIFAARIRRLPIFRWLLGMLEEGEKVKRDLVIGALELYFPREEADRQLEIIIQWGRYAEVLSYDDDSEALYRKVAVVDASGEWDGGAPIRGAQVP